MQKMHPAARLHLTVLVRGYIAKLKKSINIRRGRIEREREPNYAKSKF